jgi:hypothetical protein
MTSRKYGKVLERLGDAEPTTVDDVRAILEGICVSKGYLDEDYRLDLENLSPEHRDRTLYINEKQRKLEAAFTKRFVVHKNYSYTLKPNSVSLNSSTRPSIGSYMNSSKTPMTRCMAKRAADPNSHFFDSGLPRVLSSRKRTRMASGEQTSRQFVRLEKVRRKRRLQTITLGKRALDSSPCSQSLKKFISNLDSGRFDFNTGKGTTVLGW